MQPSFPSPPSPSDVQLTTLAHRVKEVLPHVPLNVIQGDLGMGRVASQSGRHRKVGLDRGGGQGVDTLLLSSQPGLGV